MRINCAKLAWVAGIGSTGPGSRPRARRSTPAAPAARWPPSGPRPAPASRPRKAPRRARQSRPAAGPRGPRRPGEARRASFSDQNPTKYALRFIGRVRVDSDPGPGRECRRSCPTTVPPVRGPEILFPPNTLGSHYSTVNTGTAKNGTARFGTAEGGMVCIPVLIQSYLQAPSRSP